MVRDTSMICYNDLVDQGLVNDRCQEVYNYISKHPDETDTEVAYGLGYVDPNKVRPRRKDLFDMGLVVESGKRPCVHSNRVCYTWEVKHSVPSKQFVDSKEELRDEHTYRVFKHKHLAGVIVLVHNWLNKYSAKKFRAMIDYAGFEKGVYVVRCIRENL